MTKASLSPTAAHPIRLRGTEERLWSPDLKHLVIVRGEPGDGIVNLGTYRSECEEPERFLEHRLQALTWRLKAARKAMKQAMNAIDMMTDGFIDTDHVQYHINSIRKAQDAEPILSRDTDIADLISNCLKDVEEVLKMADIDDEAT